jgi:hypothetical protein
VNIKLGSRDILITKRISIGFVASAIFGAVIWHYSPEFSGEIEPWDSDSPFYFWSLLSSGLIVGFVINPEKLWPVVLGTAIGQFLYSVLFLPLGPLMIIGFGFLLASGVLAMAGAYVGCKARGVINERANISGNGV